MSEQKNIVTVTGMHLHHSGKEFSMTAVRHYDDGRGDVTFFIMTGMLGDPALIQEYSGLPWFGEKHQGWGSYCSQFDADETGPSNFDLDPISEAVRAKGWSRQIISMHARKPDPFDGFVYTGDKPRFETEWTGSMNEYFICKETKPDIRTLAWAIVVHLNDHGHIGIKVSVPQIYREPGALTSLLAAIKTLPDTSEMEHVHPANKASTQARP